MFDCIVDQIVQHLLHQHHIAIHQRQARFNFHSRNMQGLAFSQALQHSRYHVFYRFKLHGYLYLFAT